VKTNNRPAIVGVDQRDGFGRLSSDAHMSTHIHRGRARLDLNRRSFALVVLRARTDASSVLAASRSCVCSLTAGRPTASLCRKAEIIVRKFRGVFSP
jgi:hypothetical protein